MSGAARTPEEFFDGYPDGLAIYRRVTEMIDGLGEAEVRVSKSQIAFRARRGFAHVWRPGRYVDNDVLVVLSIPLPAEHKSKRFKSVVHPSPKVWMHHLEIRDPDQVDDEVARWLRDAYDAAS
ncbi:MAG TPA: DUF5655 domain-containing protein [Propionibacteriaceae bacterium]